MHSRWFLLGAVAGFIALLFKIDVIAEGQSVFSAPGTPSGPLAVESSCGCGIKEILVPSQTSLSDVAPSNFSGGYGPGRPPRTFAPPAGTVSAPIVRYTPPQVPAVQQLGSKP